LRRLVDRALYPIIDALLLFYFVDQLRLITAALPLLSRVILVAEMAGATLFLIWLLRSKHWSGEDHAASGFARLVRVVLRLGLVIFPVTFLASVLGYVNLANLLGNGALKSAYVAAALYAAFRIVEGLIIIALRVRPLALSRVVRLHRSLLQRRLCGIARFLAVLVWLSLTLKFFALQDSLMRYGGAALEAKLTIGFLNISLGQVLVFIVTVWTSLLVSKFVRFLLEEDVYHHWRVERGIPQAISTMVHYTVLLVGFFVALAVLGVDLTKITILAGAFTVGIGFGLQTVINNFVCGLILLFERPIKSRRCGAGRCGCRRGSADRDPGVRHPHGEWFGNYSAQRNAHLQQGQKLDFFGSVPGRRGPGQRGSRRASTTGGRNIEARRRRSSRHSERTAPTGLCREFRFWHRELSTEGLDGPFRGLDPSTQRSFCRYR
jgi:potassium-dependent mechanosensitive channel